MLLHDLRVQFNKSIKPCEGTFKLMKETFGFYNKLCNAFFSNLAQGVETNQLDSFLQTKLSPSLFHPEFCQSIEERKKSVLAEFIKLEQFISSPEYPKSPVIDLNQLKDVANAVYELLQKHWELFKYQKQAVNKNVLISLMLEIDRIGIHWDAFLEHYVAILKLMKETGNLPDRAGFKPVKIQYHLPQGQPFTLALSNNLNQFLDGAYEMVCKVHGVEEPQDIQLMLLEGENPMGILLWTPEALAESFAKLLGYLSIDVIKRETLVKYVSEIVSAGAGSELPKAQFQQHQKKLTKLLEALPAEGFFAVDENASLDSVTLITSMVGELERLELEYKDLVNNPGSQLGRNRAAKLQAEPAKEAESTVKINVQEKQHLGFLTS